MKKNILLVISLFLNFLFLLLILSYIFTPYWDFAVINASIPRICEYVKEKGSIGDVEFEVLDDNLCKGY